MPSNDHHPESGRNAEASAIVESIRDELRRQGIVPDDSDGHRYDWHDERDRRDVLRQFRANDQDDDDQIWSKALLPGFGELGRATTSKETCGDPHPHVCDSCGQGLTIGNTCRESACGRCAPAWCRRAAKKKAAKIQALRQEKYYSTPDNTNANIYHVTISPRLGWFADLARAGLSLDEAREATRRVVKKILDELRAQGVVVRHPYSHKKDDGTVAESHTEDLGEWSDRLFEGREWSGDVREELAWKPHYHCLVVSDWIKTGEHQDDENIVERVEEATGWVIHRITSENSENSLDDAQAARALMYCLSHAGIEIDQHGPNRSEVWEVGSFQEDGIANSSRFQPSEANSAWAEAVTAKYAGPILGISVTGSECGRTLPAFEDGAEFARRILEELSPDEFDPRVQDVDERAVLEHVRRGDVSVPVSGSRSSSSSSSSSSSTSSTPSVSLSEDPSSTEVAEESPDVGGKTRMDPRELATDSDADHDDHGHDCSCSDCSFAQLKDDFGIDDEHPALERDEPEECDGQLIPLGDARERGLLDDPEWCRQADHVQEARRLDREWPDDLPPWYSHPDVEAVGIG
jgi:hypothetical protein